MEEIIGKTFFKIDKKEDRIDFYCTDGHLYTMLHDQDCCETVVIDDIIGDLDDLLETPILKYEENSSCGSDNNLPSVLYEQSKDDESSTWTFYNFATKNGYVTIRWYGYSNGYYSESVSFYKSDKNHLTEWREWKLSKLLNNGN